MIRNMKDKYIISEYYQFDTDINLIKEAEEKNVPVIMSGILQKADALNRNGRVYPFDILKREATRYMTDVEEGTAGGELDHPDSAVVSLTNVSHRVIDMWWQGKELYGKVLIAETENGDTLKGLLKSGFKLGISSRGVGSVKTKGGDDIVQEDFELIAFDFVSSPSTPGAFLFKEGFQLNSSKGLALLGPKAEQIVKNGEHTLNEQIKKYTSLYNISINDFWKNLNKI